VVPVSARGERLRTREWRGHFREGFVGKVEARVVVSSNVSS
jgi:hypothetical protein